MAKLALGARKLLQGSRIRAPFLVIARVAVADTVASFSARLRPMLRPDGRVVRPSGSSVDIDSFKKSETALRAANAQFSTVLAGTDDCFCTVAHHSRLASDIARRKQAEKALHRERALLQGTIDALPAKIVVVDGSGVIVAANATWRRLGEEVGCAGTSGGIGVHYLAACRTIVPPDDFMTLARGLRAVICGDQREFRMHCSRQSRGKNGRLQIRATRLDADTCSIVVAHEDVTDISRTEADLRELTGRLLGIQDEERRRIARDLHDTTAQNLVAATMILDYLRQQVDGTVREGAARLDEVRSLVERSVQEIRTLSYLLHPPLLEELGLTSALRWFIHGFERRSGIAIQFRAREKGGRLPFEVENALFRVVQEALTNVHRHSGSATAQVRLLKSTREAVLIIADRGRGMIDKPIPGKDGTAEALGVGISGMRARLHQLGGTLEIRSTVSGMKIRARVPVEARDTIRQLGDAARFNGKRRNAVI